MPPSHAAFTFTHRRLERGVIRLGYLLHGGPSPDVALEETFTLPPELPLGSEDEALDRALQALHLAAGVSYWKTSCPARIDIAEGGLPDADARFFERLWTFGLGEFFFRNGLSPRDRVAFPRAASERPPAAGPPGIEDGPPLLLFGGGKDSAVSLELLLASGESPSLLCVGRSPRLLQAARVPGLPVLNVQRAIDPKLFDLNAAGALNGHVPVTAIVQLVAQVAALLGGFGAVITSNERSASFGNAVLDGIEINHQWSKGLAFERSMQAWSARHLVVGPAPFSLLRPYSELAIAREFARHPRWFDDVTSCNANFSQQQRETPRWCGACPKCVFVFAVTTPWLDEASRMRLFGRDFFADEGNLPVLRELLGIEGQKPFECVGTPDETRAALWACHERGLHAATPAMALFRNDVLPLLSDPAALLRESLEPSTEHLIPVRFQGALHAALGSR